MIEIVSMMPLVKKLPVVGRIFCTGPSNKLAPKSRANACMLVREAPRLEKKPSGKVPSSELMERSIVRYRKLLRRSSLNRVGGSVPVKLF